MISKDKEYKRLNEILLQMIRKFEYFDSLGKKSIYKESEFAKILERFSRLIVKEERKISNNFDLNKYKRFFRSTFSKYTAKSVLASHGLNKPRGYPGDAALIEAIYNNKMMPMSKGIGLLIDKYFLKETYVQAVRERKDDTKIFLKNYINASRKKVLRILNVACGSCREIRELDVDQLSSGKEIQISFVDQDPVTLSMASKKLVPRRENVNYKFICSNVAKFYLNKRKYYKIFGKQDLIYSIGLADYLPDSILGPLLRFNYELLRDGGILFIAHKNVVEFPEPIADWFCDWRFFPRTKITLVNIINSNLPNKEFKLRVKWSDSRLLFYIIIEKG